MFWRKRAKTKKVARSASNFSEPSSFLTKNYSISIAIPCISKKRCKDNISCVIYKQTQFFCELFRYTIFLYTLLSINRKQVFQFFARYMDSVFDRTNRNIQFLRNFVVFESFEVHHKRNFVRILQTINRSVDIV